MARAVRILSLEISDDTGAGPLDVTVRALVTDDDAGAVSLGISQKADTRKARLPRAAFAALVSALRRPSTDAWPDGVLAHPVAKDP